MKIPFFLSTERVVGSGHPTFTDTINRALRSVLSLSGFNPDGDFPGFNARRNPIGDGADATGATDSQATISLSQTNANTAGLEFFPGTYLVSSNLTLSKAVTFRDGGKLKPASGVTITITGRIAAGSQQIFDLSAGGTISFAGNVGIHHYNPMWFGVKGDGVTDDQPALAHMISSIPDYALVRFPSGMVILLNSAWTISGRAGMQILGSSLPVPNPSSSMTRWIWGGTQYGDMIVFNSCDAPVFKNHFVHMDGGPSVAGRGVVSDGTGVNGITNTENTFEWIKVYSSVPYGAANSGIGQIGLDINPSQNNSNNEYHHFDNIQVYLGGSRDNVQATMTSGNVTIVGGGFGLQHVGKQIRLPGGAGGTTGLTTTVVSVVAGVSATLAVAPSSNGTVQATVGTPQGYGIRCLGNANTKKLTYRRCQLLGLSYGIYQGNGSHNRDNCSFTGCEVAIYVGNATEPYTGWVDNAEACGQHAVLGSFFANHFIIKDSRLGTTNITPGKGYIQSQGNDPCQVIVENTQFDDPIGIGSTLYDFTGANGTFVGKRNHFAGGGTYTQAQLGYTTGTGIIISEGELGIADAPNGARDFVLRNGSKYMQGASGSANPVFSADAQDGGGTQSPVGLRGTVTCPTGSFAGGTADGVQGQIVVTTGMGREGAAVRGLGVNWSTGGSSVGALAGFIADTPVVTNGTVFDHYGIILKKQKAASGRVNNGHGIYQQDAGDDNLFNGPTAFGSKRNFKVTTATIGSGGTDGFDSSTMSVRRLTANGNLTVGNTTNVPANGDQLALEVLNNTAGAITVTLGSAFLGTFTGPGAGKWRTQDYIYDGTLSKWKPRGAQSPDL